MVLSITGVLFLSKCGYQIYDALRPENMCGKTLGVEKVSPSGENKAVIYEFNCGAMDPFSTQISILGQEVEIPFSGGNIFASSRGKLRGSWNGPYAEIEWKSQNHLHVKHIHDTNIHFKNQEFKGILITYEVLQ